MFNVKAGFSNWLISYSGNNVLEEKQEKTECQQDSKNSGTVGRLRDFGVQNYKTLDSLEVLRKDLNFSMCFSSLKQRRKNSTSGEVIKIRFGIDSILNNMLEMGSSV